MFQPGRHFLGLSTLLVLGILLLPHLSSAQVQVVPPETNFTPSVLKSGLLDSAPHGVVFRPTTGDLLSAQNGAAQVLLVNATSGASKTFATQSLANQIAVRSSDGVVAVTTGSAGSINFYSSSGALLGSIPTVAPCIGGLAFDASGDLFVAGGVNFEGCQSNALYEFSGATPWNATPPFSSVASFNGSDDIEGLAFSAAPPPPSGSGTLYAVSSTTGTIYEITCLECGGDISTNAIATAPSSFSPWGIAIDPLSGDIYISEFNGPNILRMSPPDNSCVVECILPTPSPFATGFSNTSGLTFDTNGNLYVNETNTGKLWKFTRNSFATALQQILQGQTLTFINPNPAMSDQTQTIFIPQSANLCDSNGHCAAFIQAIFVPVQELTLNARLAQGSFGDSNFFGGGPVPPGTTCVPIPSASPNSASPNCVNVVQKCYDASHKPFDICPVHEPVSGPGNTDLIQLTFKWTDPDPSFVAAPNTAFLIDFDTAPDTGTLTNITDMTDPGGGTRSLCSVTMTALLGSATSDFSLGPIPSPVTIGVPATVPVTSIGTFNSLVNLSVSDVPPGVTAALSQPSVTPSPGSTDSSTTLTVTGTFGSANTPAGIATVVANLLASGCIDNTGIANALTSKLSAAQAAINGGQIQTAINTLGAFKSQVQAQSGNHISGSCTTTFTLLVTGTSSGVVHLASANVSATSTNAAGILAADASSAITRLAGANTADPIVGTVLNAPMGTMVTILDGTGTSTVLGPTTTDSTGFYYFANTGLVKGVSYTIKVTLPGGFNGVTPSSQIFTWAGKGLVFNFTLF